MGRAKTSMELITKEKTRNTTYEKRKLGIIKKATEFTVLCDVDTILIMYPPNSNHPEIWPENPDQIKKTIASYKAKKNETRKRTYDLTDFFQDRKKKIEDELLRARKRNMEAKYPTWFDELNCLSEGQLREFAFGLESKETIVRAQLKFIKRNVQMPMPFGSELENSQQFVHQATLYPSVDPVLAALYPSDDQVQASFYPSDDEVQATLYPGVDPVQAALYPGVDQVQAALYPGVDQVQAALYPGVAQVQAANQHLINHDLGWFGYPVFEGGMVYDNPNPLVFQQMVQCGLMPLQVNHDHVYDGVGDFVMDPHQGGFTFTA